MISVGLPASVRPCAIPSASAQSASASALPGMRLTASA